MENPVLHFERANTPENVADLVAELQIAFDSMTTENGMPQWPMGDANKIRMPIAKALTFLAGYVRHMGEG